MNSVYIHFPFCQKRCGYCDFFTRAGMDHFIPKYIDALVKEINSVSAASPAKLPVHTIYIGGGTPSLASPAQIAAILEAVNEGFIVSSDAEITMESNPGTVNAEKLKEYYSAGVNRLSFGVQSFQPDELILLERIHTVHDVSEAVNWARTAGFENLSLDLIYGLPGQSLASWQNTLEQALVLHPEHLSLYALTVEDGTPLFEQVQSGAVSTPDDDLAAEMYLQAEITLAAAGFLQYEISNWAATRNGKLLSSRHNLQYWLNEPYFGFGAGAHGCVSGYRLANVADIPTYIQFMASQNTSQFPLSAATDSKQKIDTLTEMNETMMLSLRLTEMGISQERFLNRYGKRIEDVFSESVSRLIQQGLLTWNIDQNTLHLTGRGRLLGNRVFREFV